MSIMFKEIYKLKVRMSKNNPGNTCTWGKRSSSFFPGASLTDPQGIVHYASFFWMCSGNTHPQKTPE